MPRSPVNARIRQQELVKMLRKGTKFSTQDAAKRLGTSAMTIRRDLKTLAASGAAIRCYGGAVPAQRITFEFAFDDRRRMNLPAKQAIGQRAADMVKPGQTILLDTGTTTLEIARALALRDIPCRVITSSLVVASVLWAHANIELLLLGGRVRQGSPDLAGPLTELMLQGMTADVAFLGTEGLHPRRGSFAGDFDTARVAAGMVASAKRVTVVADATKLGQAGTARYATVDQIDEIITDAADARTISELRKAGVTVTIAE